MDRCINTPQICRKTIFYHFLNKGLAQDYIFTRKYSPEIVKRKTEYFLLPVTANKGGETNSIVTIISKNNSCYTNYNVFNKRVTQCGGARQACMCRHLPAPILTFTHNNNHNLSPLSSLSFSIFKAQKLASKFI